MESRRHGKKNVYEQIVEEYSRFIRTGALKEGEKLPSCRALAAERGVNPNTVERAFAELERLGLVQTVPKKGVFVLAAAEPDAEVRRQIRALAAAGISREKLLSVLYEEYEKIEGKK